ncbi:MAG: tetratricopeptide repeat protein [Acidobacteria bacterium]|nr:tetratricopeptide repeat protein [Acidobacteriota bacterium]
MPSVKKRSSARRPTKSTVPTKRPNKPPMSPGKRARRAQGKAKPKKALGKRKPGAQSSAARRRLKKTTPSTTRSARRTPQKSGKSKKTQSGATDKALAARKKDEKTLLDLYERGIKALYSKNYQQGMDAFSKLIESYPEEIELADRARNFVKICQSQGAVRRVQQPKSAEEMFDLGVIEHNTGNFERAIQYFENAIGLAPKGDYLHYALAASYSQGGDMEHAVRSLQRAIQFNPENRFLARNDPDFEAIRSSREFAAVVDLPKTE